MDYTDGEHFKCKPVEEGMQCSVGRDSFEGTYDAIDFNLLIWIYGGLHGVRK
jgi:hypothetical protein